VSLPAKDGSSVPLFVTVIDQAPARAVPPLSFTTCLITVSVAVGTALSSLVMVQVFVSLRASVPVQPTAPVLVYPATTASSTLYGARPGTSIRVPLPLPGNEPVIPPPLAFCIWREKLPARAVPPLSFTTCLITVNLAGGMSSLITVQVLVSPAWIVPVQSP